MMTAERLKGSLLQLAMQGKLVEQRTVEGTGDELLQGVKRGTVIDPDTQENLFEIPGNWCWVQLGDFCELYTGNSISETVKKAKYMKDIDGYPYIATKDVQFDNSVDYSNGVIIPYDEGFRHAYSGSVLMCIEGGSAGRKITLIDRDVCFGNKLCMFNSAIAYNRFIYYYLQSPVFKNEFKDGISGIIGGVSIKKLKKMWIPLPPFDEQKRIVVKIEELMPFIEQYAEASTKLNTLNTTFPEMMKKSILQEAVQGKLVPQDSNDELASELLKRIAEEKQKLIKEGKIKKHKELPEITEDEIPFDIPESWEWVRLQKLALAIVDCPHSTPKYLEEITGYYALGTKGIGEEGRIRGFFNIDKNTYLKRIERLEPRENDIVYSREGSIICRAAILPGNMNICLGQRVMLIRCPEGIMPEYLQQYLMADSTITVLTKNYKGVGVKHINVADVCKLPVPVPPVNEQKRIVDIIRDIFPLIKTISV